MATLATKQVREALSELTPDKLQRFLPAASS
jgi:hypothetical protein